MKIANCLRMFNDSSPRPGQPFKGCAYHPLRKRLNGEAGALRYIFNAGKRESFFWGEGGPLLPVHGASLILRILKLVSKLDFLRLISW